MKNVFSEKTYHTVEIVPRFVQLIRTFDIPMFRYKNPPHQEKAGIVEYYLALA